jgi:cation:H+ antiporter
MLFHVILFLIGIVTLYIGSVLFLKAAVGLAIHSGLSPFLIGMLVVGFGTSVPELAANWVALLDGSLDIALGNIVGSNIANIGLILGLAAMIAPLVVHARVVRIELTMMVGVSVSLWILSAKGEISRLSGGGLVFLFFLLFVYIFRKSSNTAHAVHSVSSEESRPVVSLTTIAWQTVLGLSALIAGADLMVRAAVQLARFWGMSELVIGLTIVAVGTSLPELASSMMAAWHGHNDIVVGNVVGSNIFNVLLVLGSTALIHPVPVRGSLLWMEIPVMIVLSVMLLFLLKGGRKIGRSRGALLLFIYLVFLFWQVSSVQP